jgi:hypothetical protein
MILWTFQWTTISLVLILLVHYLYTYLKNTFTIPIVDDSSLKNKKRYDDMLAPIRSEIETTSNIGKNVDVDDIDVNSMKDELQAFLNELKPNDETKL